MSESAAASRYETGSGRMHPHPPSIDADHPPIFTHKRKAQTPEAMKHPVWFSQLTDAKRKCFRRKYYQLLEVVLWLLETRDKLVPPRLRWEDAFTTRCDSTPTCLECRQCRIRFAQATIVVVAAQGVRDSLVKQVIPHFGAVFRHPRYVGMSVEEWAAVSLGEMITIFSGVSKQGISSMIVLKFLEHFVGYELPTNKECITCFHGFGKKSACLLLGANGREEVGIPVDRHLKEALCGVGWALDCRSAVSISEMVEMWLPRKKWAGCNTLLAGIRQIWQNARFKPLLIQTATQLGKEELDLILAVCDTQPQSEEDAEEEDS
jgi:endonuclease III